MGSRDSLPIAETELQYLLTTYTAKDKSFKLMDAQLQNSTIVKDLGTTVSSNVTWKTHVEKRLNKANNCSTNFTGMLQRV